MGAKQSNPLYPSRALRADPSADDSSVGEDNLSGVVFSNERPEAHESKGGFFNLEHYESAVPELPAVAVSREPDASINSDLAGNDAVCSTCPSRPSP